MNRYHHEHKLQFCMYNFMYMEPETIPEKPTSQKLDPLLKISGKDQLQDQNNRIGFICVC